MKHVRRNFRAISPVLAVLMMIAIAIAGSLVVYAWVMGYIRLSTEKSGQEILIQSIFNDGDDLLVYVQNTGEGLVQLEEDACLYINGQLVDCKITNVTVSDGIATLNEGETATLWYIGGAAPPGERVKVRVTTTEGTPAEKYDYPAGSARASSVLDHFRFDTVSSPQTSDTAFTITIRAINQYNEPFPSYNGTNTLTYSSGEITPSTTGSFISGVWTGEVTVTGSATATTITTVSQDNSSWTGTSNTFVTIEKPPPTVWSKTYGGESYERAWSVAKTSDGGYAIAGEVTGAAFCLVKAAADGTMEWNKTYGIGLYGVAHSVIQASDGGYAVAGSGNSRFLLVKTSADGTMEWNKTYEGTGSSVARSVIQTSDGGYVIAGRTNWGAGNWDFWLIKTSADGTVEWDKEYGGTGDDLAYAVVRTDDGGYAIAGYTMSYGAGMDDCWLVKTDSEGEMEWRQTYGGPNDDCAFALVTTSDGGYALAGSTKSFGVGYCNFWLIKTDADGYEEWNCVYGEPEADDHAVATSLVLTLDGGYALAGYSDAVNGTSLQYDFWLVKTDASGHHEWNQTYVGDGINYAQSIVAATDGGYALAGNIQSSDGDYDFWLVKTDEYGNTEK